MQIRVLYFAGVRDLLGLREESLSLEEGTPLAALLALLRERYPVLSPHWPAIRIAKNEQFVEDGVLREGDRVALIPPVAGG